MNRELISRLYRQSAEVAATRSDDSPSQAWAWEEAFAKAIVLVCSRVAKLAVKDNRVCDAIENHFGIES